VQKYKKWLNEQILLPKSKLIFSYTTLSKYQYTILRHFAMRTNGYQNKIIRLKAMVCYIQNL